MIKPCVVAGLSGLFLLLALPTTARAQGDTLYGALVMASNVEHPAEAPPAIRPEADNLRAVFGYNDFVILGQKRKPMVDGTDDWLVSSPKFFLRVDTKKPVPGGYALALQLFCEKRIIAQARAKLTRETPLFIRGPMVARGQLIILLKIQETPAAADRR